MSSFPGEWINFQDTGGGFQSDIVRNGCVGGGALNLSSLTCVVTEIWYKVRCFALTPGGSYGGYVNLFDTNGTTLRYQVPITLDLGVFGEISDTIPLNIPMTPGYGARLTFSAASPAGVAQAVRMKGIFV